MFSGIDLYILTIAYECRGIFKQAIYQLPYSSVNILKRYNILLKKQYISCHTIRNNNIVIKTTAAGKCHLEEILHIKLSDGIDDAIGAMKYNTAAQERMLRTAWVIAMVTRLVPNLPFEFLETICEANLHHVLLPKFSGIGLPSADKNIMNPAGPGPLVPDLLTGTDIVNVPEAVRVLARRKASLSEKGRYMVLEKELLNMSHDKVRALAGSAAIGVMHIESGDFAVYALRRKAMGGDQGREIKMMMFYDICTRTMDRRLNLLFLGRGYTPLYNFIKATRCRNLLMLSGLSFQNRYYIRFSANGASQLALLTVSQSDESIMEALIPAADRLRASRIGSQADGYTEGGTPEYNGCTCDMDSLADIYDWYCSKWKDKKIIIFSYEWQARFYDKLFRGFADIRVVNIKDVLNMFHL